MFKKLSLVILLWSYTFISSAEKPPIFPDTLSIKKIKNCNSCVELKENGELFASLQPDSQKKDVFYFLDKDNQRQLTLKHTENKVYSSNYDDSELIVSYFDVFDTNNVLVANLRFNSDTRSFAFYYFQILAPNKIKLIEGSEFLAGTKTSLNDVRFGQRHMIGQLTKPLFTFSLDAQLQITDKQELAYFIDPNVFYATLAMNSNDDFFYSLDTSSASKKISKSISTEALYTLS